MSLVFVWVLHHVTERQNGGGSTQRVSVFTDAFAAVKHAGNLLADDVQHMVGFTNTAFSLVYDAFKVGL